METALRLFSERGYLGVRVEDIAREAGVSRATFYKYFAEREEILAALLSRLFAERSSASTHPGIETADPSEDLTGDIVTRVKAAARALVVTMLGQEQLARFVYSLPVRHDALIGSKQAQIPPALGLIDRLLEQAASAGELRDDIPDDLVCAAVHGAVEATMRDWAAGRGGEPLASLDQRLELIFRGALPAS